MADCCNTEKNSCINQEIRVTVFSTETGNWNGLYINDILVVESDKLSDHDVISALKEHFPITYERIVVSEKLLAENNGCPDTLKG